MVAVDRINAILGAVDRRPRDLRHQFGQRPGVIFFCVIDDDVIQGFKINFRRQILYKLTAKFMVYRIDQHRFLFTDQIAVIAAAL
ncbi:hypothetical protein D3C80_1366350 [compost metagenome]